MNTSGSSSRIRINHGHSRNISVDSKSGSKNHSRLRNETRDGKNGNDRRDESVGGSPTVRRALKAQTYPTKSKDQMNPKRIVPTKSKERMIPKRVVKKPETIRVPSSPRREGHAPDSSDIDERLHQLELYLQSSLL